MTDREKVIKGLECCKLGCDYGCPYAYSEEDCTRNLASDALELLKAKETRQKNMLRSWKMIKFSVLDTAHNNADAGNEDFYKLLTWVANMMDQQEAKWDG